MCTNNTPFYINGNAAVIPYLNSMVVIRWQWLVAPSTSVVLFSTLRLVVHVEIQINTVQLVHATMWYRSNVVSPFHLRFCQAPDLRSWLARSSQHEGHISNPSSIVKTANFLCDAVESNSNVCVYVDNHRVAKPPKFLFCKKDAEEEENEGGKVINTLAV